MRTKRGRRLTKRNSSYSHPNGATVRVCIDQSQKDCVGVQKGTFEGRGASCSCTLVHRVVHLAPRISKVPLFNAHTLFSGLVYSDGSHKISNVEARGRRNLLERKHRKVRRSMTKTTPPVKSHRHGRSSCTSQASQISKSVRIAYCIFFTKIVNSTQSDICRASQGQHSTYKEVWSGWN